MSFKSSLLKNADSLFGPPACCLLSRAQQAPEHRHADDIAGPILLIRPGGIGDAVLLLPALSALRAALPGRQLDILCESRNRAVFELAAPDARIVAYDHSPVTALRLLRGTPRHAAVIDTEQFHNFSAVMTALTRAPLRIGFKINTHRRGLYTHLVSYDLDGPEDAQFGRLLAAALGRTLPLPPRLGILPARALPELPPENRPSAPFLVLHAGGSIPHKRIPDDTFSEACRQLADSTDLAFAVIGSTEDLTAAQTLAARIGPRAMNLCGRLSLTQTAALCREAGALVGPDSGIAHLAVAVGTPAVVIFGPSDPAKWGPPEDAGEAAHIPLPCSPCSIFGYTKPCTHPECMAGITAGQIVDAVQRTLAKGKQTT